MSLTCPGVLQGKPSDKGNSVHFSNTLKPVLNFLSTTLPSSNGNLFQASLTLNKLLNQMYLLENLLIKLPML